MKRPANFDSVIHVTDYRKRYETSAFRIDTVLNTDGRVSESLDGNWNFMVDPFETMLRADWYTENDIDAATGKRMPVDFDFDAWPTVKVPSCWNTESRELFLYEGMCSYSRHFSFRRNPGERVFLHFEGVSYRAYVFLNGKEIAFHDGASTPFSIEITDIVKPENMLVVGVENFRSPERVPMNNIDWFNYGGIYRDVSIIRTPENYLSDWYIRLDDEYRILVDLSVVGEGERTAIFEIPELGIRKEIPIADGKGSAVITADMELWTPENPKLYGYSIRLDGDVVSDRMGFRTLKVDGKRILLNGEEIFLRGISMHEDDDEIGKTTDEEHIRKTIGLVKDELGANFMRLAHYPHSGLFSRIAEEMGLLLWEEIPVYWAIAFDSEKTIEDASNQLRELILRDRNRASVAIWSVGNENPDTDERLSFMSHMADLAHELDPSRPVSAACLVNVEKEMIEDRLAEKLDVVGFNEYYGWYKTDFPVLGRILRNSSPDKPVIITEFGAGARYGFHGTKDEMWSEEFQADVFKRQIEVISSSDYISGMTPWCLYDFRALRRMNRYQEGYNRKGLIDSDKIHRKMAFDVLADFYRRITG